MQFHNLYGNILDGFNEPGVQIMTPAYKGDPNQPKVVRRERWYTALARAPQPTQPAVSASAMR